ncbi:MAG: DUF4091 domain-containing protein [Alloprevotella sp.]
MKKKISLAIALLLGPVLWAQPRLSWISTNVHPAPQAEAPARLTADTTLTVWRGERASMQAVVYAAEATGPLQLRWSGTKKSATQAPQAEARFVRYVTTDNFQYCGYHPTYLTPYAVPDLIADNASCSVQARSAQPVWCTFEVPQAAAVGTHRYRLELVDSATCRVVGRLHLSLKVLSRTLPTPQEQAFHVDFWQQPYAVARQHGVPRWSEAHFEALKPYLRLLARSGQKVISTILFYEPWGDQSYDKFDPMVRTVKRKDGSWAYDYSVFDRYVQLCLDCGIGPQINCFSMVPWDMKFRYFDEAQGKQVDLAATTSSSEYRELWTAFLTDFAAHLRQKGWFDHTCIAMDERGLDAMLDAYRVAQEAVPGLKMALAGNYHAELVDKLHDYCIAFGQDFSDEELAVRRRQGRVSTTYTCCSNTHPNLFSNSLPAEAAFLPVYCIANQFDGYLHWSWMNWDDKSLTDTRYRLFAPGDTYLVYPGPQSSVRYERFIEGVALAEKVRLLRQELDASQQSERLERLNRLVQRFEPDDYPEGESAATLVDALKAEVNLP